MIRACFAFSALVALSGPVLAQEAPAPTAQLPVAQPQPMVRTTTAARDRLAGSDADFRLRDSVKYAERLGRAERLAALVGAGQCLSAYRVALREYDYQMAENLATACDLPARDVRSARRFALR